jgi:hypothetical protein
MLSSVVINGTAMAASGLIALVIAFQVALASGAPWGTAAFGGRFARDDGRLPTRHRVNSAVAALALSGAAWLVLAAGSVIGRTPVPEGVLTATTWALTLLFALNTLANLSGKHPVERFGAGAIAAALTVLCLVIALAR